MKNLRIHYFQHVPYEGLGCIENWALGLNHKISSTHFFENYTLPETDEFDWLFVMGGPMGTYDEDKYHWLKEEKIIVEKAIKANKVIVGICLGSQIIANVLGASVYKNTEKEIGFFPISFTKDAESDKIFRLIPNELDVFHWHSDTFDLPQGAKRIAFSEATKNQAYIFNNKVIGLQFHLEMAKNDIMNIMENNRSDLIKGKYVQHEAEIKKNLYCTIELNVFMKCILERLQRFT